MVIEKSTRDSLASRLIPEGYSICLTATGAEALEALGRHNITHAVILNAISLRTNGARTCASLKRAEPSLPVLIVTDQGKPPKADELLEPNISTRKLINRVEAFLSTGQETLSSVRRYFPGRGETASIFTKWCLPFVHQRNPDPVIPDKKEGRTCVQGRAIYQDLENFLRG